MRLARAAKALGVNPRTITLWIERPELTPFFSPPARLRGLQRELSDDDLLVANTIRAMRAGVANWEANWAEIAERLASGERESTLPAEAATVDSGMTALAQHAQVSIVAAERDSAVKRVAELLEQERVLRAELRDAYRAQADDRERLLREAKAEQRQLEQQLAATLAELELWRAGRLKPE